MTKKKSFMKKEVIKLSGKEALINSANKLNRSMPEISRGCGIIGDKKYNRKKSKRAIQKEVDHFKDGSFNFYILNITFNSLLSNNRLIG